MDILYNYLSALLFFHVYLCAIVTIYVFREDKREEKPTEKAKPKPKAKGEPVVVYSKRARRSK